MKVWVVDSYTGIENVFDSAEKAYDCILDFIYQSPCIEQEACIAELKEEFEYNKDSFGVEDFMCAMVYKVN